MSQEPTALSRLLTPLFSELEREGIRYCVLRGFASLPETTRNDVDFAIDPSAEQRAAAIVERVARGAGWLVVGHTSQSGFRRFLRNWLVALGQRRNGDESLRGSFEEFIEKHAEETEEIDAQERAMLLNMLSFGELRVDDVMVPRQDIVGIDLDEPWEQVLEQLTQTEYTRLPVYRESIDDVDGFLHIRTIIGKLTQGRLDFGPWEQIFYGEFDGRRKKRVLVKVIGK